MSCVKIVLVFTFLAALQLVQCENSAQEDNFEQIALAPAVQGPESKIGYNYRRQPRQNDDEDNEDSDSTSKRTAPLIPVLANILKQAIGGENATLTNVTQQFQSLSKLVFRPITNPIRGLTNFLGLTKPETEAPPLAAAKSGNPDSKQAVPPVFPSKPVEIKNEKAEVVEPTGERIQNREPRYQY